MFEDDLVIKQSERQKIVCENLRTGTELVSETEKVNVVDSMKERLEVVKWNEVK